jgi:hypothetical protein
MDLGWSAPAVLVVFVSTFGLVLWVRRAGARARSAAARRDPVLAACAGEQGCSGAASVFSLEVFLRSLGVHGVHGGPFYFLNTERQSFRCRHSARLHWNARGD